MTYGRFTYSPSRCVFRVQGSVKHNPFLFSYPSNTYRNGFFPRGFLEDCAETEPATPEFGLVVSPKRGAKVWKLMEQVWWSSLKSGERELLIGRVGIAMETIASDIWLAKSTILAADY